MKRPIPSHPCSLLIACSLAILVVGCKEKATTEQVIEKSKTSNREAGAAIKDAAQKTGTVVGRTAGKAWEGIKQGAHEVSQMPTNVAGEITAGAAKAGDAVKQATK